MLLTFFFFSKSAISENFFLLGFTLNHPRGPSDPMQLASMSLDGAVIKPDSELHFSYAHR